MSDDKAKAIGTPVVTWQECLSEIVRIAQDEKDTKRLRDIADALSGAQQLASGRRSALRSMRGKSLLDPDGPA